MPFLILKFVYNLYLLLVYKLAWKFITKILCNSTWTKQHIDSLSSCNPFKSEICYPACNVQEFFANDFQGKTKTIVSYAQFRPEKRQYFQILAFEKF
jgi:hypothetical protein